MDSTTTKTTGPTGEELLPSRTSSSNPALTIPVRITAEEHARIAAFCGRSRITVAEYVTFAGIGVDVDDYEKDPTNRAALIEDIAKRFGGSWPPAEPDPATRVVTVEFGRQAYAWLEAMTAYDGYATPADRIRAGMARDVSSLAEAIDYDEMKRIFAVAGEEGREG